MKIVLALLIGLVLGISFSIVTCYAILVPSDLWLGSYKDRVDSLLSQEKWTYSPKTIENYFRYKRTELMEAINLKDSLQLKEDTFLIDFQSHNAKALEELFKERQRAEFLLLSRIELIEAQICNYNNLKYSEPAYKKILNEKDDEQIQAVEKLLGQFLSGKNPITQSTESKK